MKYPAYPLLHILEAYHIVRVPVHDIDPAQKRPSYQVFLTAFNDLSPDIKAVIFQRAPDTNPAVGIFLEEFVEPALQDCPYAAACRYPVSICSR